MIEPDEPSVGCDAVRVDEASPACGNVSRHGDKRLTQRPQILVGFNRWDFNRDLVARPSPLLHAAVRRLIDHLADELLHLRGRRPELRCIKIKVERLCERQIRHLGISRHVEGGDFRGGMGNYGRYYGGSMEYRIRKGGYRLPFGARVHTSIDSIESAGFPSVGAFRKLLSEED